MLVRSLELEANASALFPRSDPKAFVVGNYLLFNSNENVQQFSLKTHLNETLTLGAIHYQFWLDEKNYMGAAVRDRRFADESVIFLDWTPTPSFYTSLSYNWVKPLAAAKQVAEASRRILEGTSDHYLTFDATKGHLPRFPCKCSPLLLPTACADR